MVNDFVVDEHLVARVVLLLLVGEAPLQNLIDARHFALEVVKLVPLGHVVAQQLAAPALCCLHFGDDLRKFFPLHGLRLFSLSLELVLLKLLDAYVLAYNALELLVVEFVGGEELQGFETGNRS